MYGSINLNNEIIYDKSLIKNILNIYLKNNNGCSYDEDNISDNNN